MIRRWWLILGLLLASCGSAEIVAPGALVVVDTFPGQGAVVDPGEVPIVVAFSEAVDPATLEDGVTVAVTSRTGAVMRQLDIALDDYDRDRFTATYTVEAFPADATFLLTVDDATVVATSRARLAAPVERRFTTTP
ncbi:MAG: Ig-like domain-containing protein [Deltaproteobacteria bacterium]